MSPVRLQRQRAKGYRMPKGAVYVGRPSVWGNPYKINAPHPVHGWPMSAQETCDLYAAAIHDNPLGPRSREQIRHLLGGRDLVCWCDPWAPCHADVLLREANP